MMVNSCNFHTVESSLLLRDELVYYANVMSDGGVSLETNNLVVRSTICPPLIMKDQIIDLCSKTSATISINLEKFFYW